MGNWITRTTKHTITKRIKHHCDVCNRHKVEVRIQAKMKGIRCSIISKPKGNCQENYPMSAPRGMVTELLGEARKKWNLNNKGYVKFPEPYTGWPTPRLKKVPKPWLKGGE